MLLNKNTDSLDYMPFFVNIFKMLLELERMLTEKKYGLIT
jgi:hypothetical protein